MLDYTHPADNLAELRATHQRKPISEFLRSAGLAEIESRRDLALHERATLARRSAAGR